MRLVGGAVLFVPGMIMYMNENRHTYDCDEQLRRLPLGLATALMVAGALVITPSFGKTLTSVFVTIAPYIPVLGGKRASDPQPPEEAPK